MPERSEPEVTLDLNRFFVVLARRWQAIVLGTAVGVAGSFAWLSVSPPTATAVTDVNVSVISAEPFGLDRPASDLIDATTEVQLARSSSVVGSVAEGLGSASSAEVRAATTATLLPDSTVLRLTYNAASLSRAVEGANLLAASYLDYRSNLAEDRAGRAVERLSERREALSDQLSDLRGQLNETTSPEERSTLQAAISSTSGALAASASRLGQLQGLDTTGGTVLTVADGGTTSFAPSVPVVVLTGLFAGLILGVLLAFVRNTRDRRVWDSHDTITAGGGEVWTSVDARGLTTPDDANADDAVRTVRERLLSSLPHHRRVAALVGVGRGGGHGDLGTRLAMSFASAGFPVRLVLLEGVGSRDRVAETLDLAEADTSHGMFASRRSRSHPRVSVVSPTSRDALDGLPSFLDEVGEDGVTLVGLTPGTGVAARLVAGRATGGVVLVLSERDSSITEVAQVSGALRTVGAVVLGSVLVSTKRGRSARARGEGNRQKRSRGAGQKSASMPVSAETHRAQPASRRVRT